jgi:NAD(P)H-nitrite reductase large subunit
LIMTVSDLEIFRAAHPHLDRYGDQAVAKAREMVRTMRERGDFAVGLATLQRAIVERQLTTVAEIARALRAGTNCGSCVPELRAILVGARAGDGGAKSNEPSP